MDHHLWNLNILEGVTTPVPLHPTYNTYIFNCTFAGLLINYVSKQIYIFIHLVHSLTCTVMYTYALDTHTKRHTVIQIFGTVQALA